MESEIPPGSALAVVPPPPGALLVPGAAGPEPPGLVYLATLDSRRSRQAMASCLRRAWKLLGGGEGGEAAPWQVLTYSDLVGLRARLAQSPLAPATGNQILDAVRGALRQAWRLGLITGDAWARLQDCPRLSGKREPTGRELSPDEVARLFEVIPPTPEGARDAALLAVLLGAGLRREEAATLPLSAFEPAAFERLGGLRVIGKGNKEARVPLPPGARAALDAWLGLRGDEHGPLFPHVIKGTADWVNRPISGRHVQTILSRLAAAAGVTDVSPHDLRRTCASRLLAATGDLSLTKSYLRHENIATTARYDRRGDAALARGARHLAVPVVAR